MEGELIPKYQLKKRLQTTYPSLVFAKRFQKSELVYFPSERMHSFSEISSNSSESDDDIIECTEGEEVQSLIKRREAFYGAMEIKKSLESVPSLQAPWPPTSEHLTNDAAQRMVPESVFNFLALATGCSNEPCISGYAKVSEEKRTKLLSISQDLIVLNSNGRKYTPKHLALSLTGYFIFVVL